MTDLDTTPPVVMALLSRHPASRAAAGPASDRDAAWNAAWDAASDAARDADHPDGVQDDAAAAEAGAGGATVLPLNDAAAVYDALAAQIAGTAVGWSDDALAKLEQGLLQRYGPAVGGRQPVRRLIRLAARPPV
jgi:hypothetical protein